jgi:hypothetical protein
MLDKLTALISQHKVAATVAAVLGGLTLYAANDSGGGLAAGGGGTSPHEVIDQSGFERPVRALTIPAPQGWQVQSEVRWNNMNGTCSAGVASPAIRMTSPDGREQIEILPGYLVTTNSDNITNRGTMPGDFCVLALAESGEALIRSVIVPRLRAGARIDRINAVPLTPDQQSSQSQLEQLARSSGQMRASVYSFEVWLTHQDGTVEVLLAAGYVIASPQVIAGVPPLVFNATDGIVSVRAAPQRIEALLQTARALVAAVEYNPEWKAEIEETQRVVSAPVSARGGRGGSGGGGGFDMDRWREDQRRDDEAQRRRIETIREVERCYDPETGRTYEVSIHVGC